MNNRIKRGIILIGFGIAASLTSCSPSYKCTGNSCYWSAVETPIEQEVKEQRAIIFRQSVR